VNCWDISGVKGVSQCYFDCGYVYQKTVIQRKFTPQILPLGVNNNFVEYLVLPEFNVMGYLAKMKE
jgi:hypothetical protein